MCEKNWKFNPKIALRLYRRIMRPKIAYHDNLQRLTYLMLGVIIKPLVLVHIEQCSIIINV